MTSFTFPVTTHGKRHAAVEVRVYSSRASMIRGLRSRHRRNGSLIEDGWYEGTAAATSPFSRMTPPHGHWRHEAVIFLTKDNCGSTVVSHEASHAAWFFYREQVQKTVPDMEREEVFCHLVSEITGKMVNGLYEAGCY